jgi:ribonuclease HI
MYNAYTDGGSRNDQHAACAWIITDQDNSILHMNSTYLGACSNNTSEYYGLIFCLTSALAGGIKELRISGQRTCLTSNDWSISSKSRALETIVFDCTAPHAKI